MKRILQALLGLFLFAGIGIAQTVGPGKIVFVYVAPSGSCAQGSAVQVVITTGVVYTCQNGTWGSIGGNTGATVISSGSIALATSLITSYNCQAVTAGSVNSATATGVETTDTISWNPNASLTSVTGYAPSSSGGLTIVARPSAGYVNWDVCNWTAASITPGAVTLNWSVVR